MSLSRLHRAGITALVVCTLCAPSAAFLIQTYDGDDGPVTLKWRSDTIRYVLNATGSDDMQPAAAFGIIREAFATWSRVPTSRLEFQDDGVDAGATANRRDRRNVVIFDETGRTLSAPAGSGIIAVTRLNSDVLTGAISDADIIYNDRDFTFAADPVGDQIDLLDVTTHEIGHFFGLNHTPLTGNPALQPTMNPFYSGSPGEASSLAADDIAGISTMYPTSEHRSTSGTISGIVTDRAGTPLFGTHVVAQGADGTLVSILSGAEGGQEQPGNYTLRGLNPGDYSVRIEPLSHGISEENFGGIFTNLATDIPGEFFDNVVDETLAQIITIPPGALRNVRNIDFVTGLALPGYPSVTSLIHPANTPDIDGPYLVSIEATDAEQLILMLEISDAEGISQAKTIPLLRDEANSFAAEIPGQVAGSKIRYRVVATGSQGRVTYFPGEQTWVDFDIVPLTGAPLAFAVMRSAGAVRIFDTGSDREISRVSVGQDPIQMVSSVDGRLVFVADLGGSEIAVLERATFRVIERIPVAASPLDMTISADGSTLYVTNSDAGRLTAIDTQRLTVVGDWVVGQSAAGPYGVATSASDRIYVTDLNADEIIIFEEGQVTARLRGPSQPRTLARSSDGETIYVSSFNSGLLGRIDDATGTVAMTDLGSLGTFAVVAHPTRDLLYLTAHIDDQLLVVQASTGSVLERVDVGNDPRGLSLSPDHRRLYVTSTSDEIYIVDTETYQILGVYPAAGGPRGIVIVASPQDISTIVGESSQPTAWALSAAFPNPFNPETQLEIVVGEGGETRLDIYNALGQRLRTLLSDPELPTGHRLRIRWDGRDATGRGVASGVYVFVLEFPGGRQIRKGMLLR